MGRTGISPQIIIGNTGTYARITCISSRLREAENNVLQIFDEARGVFERFESSRVHRTSDVGELTTFIFGPLMLSDNGTILSCLSNRLESEPATVIVSVGDGEFRD